MAATKLEAIPPLIRAAQAHQQALALHRAGRWAEAVEPYSVALSLDPDNPALRHAYGHLLLGLGDYPGGWPFYESRKDVAGTRSPRPPLANEWSGEPIAGKRLLLWPEQGFGDMVQFSRFAPALRAAGAEVTLVCPPELATFFATLGVEVVPYSASMTLPAPDGWAHLMSAPMILGSTIDTLPPPALRVPEDYREKWKGRVPEGLVGVVWRGSAANGNDAHRSLPESPIPALDREGRLFADLSDGVGDFADTAAIVEQLDLVITVDTAMAHVVGSLGRPCWLLLPTFQQDWRWLQGRETSPWYPSVRIFRQGPEGSWPPVIAAVAEALDTREALSRGSITASR